MWTEIPVFVRGIVLDPSPEKEFANFVKKLGMYSHVTVEWGWKGSHNGDRILASAQEKIYRKLKKIEAKDLTLNPLRKVYEMLRKEFILGFSDIFYYVSSDGEREVRKTVFESLSKEILKHEKVSLTFFAHSAGTVILHDFLYHVFGKKSKFSYIKLVKRMVSEGRLRIRKIFTFGSPLTPLLFRASSLLKKANSGRKLSVKDLGLNHKNQWINIWDKDDVFSFPVDFMYKPRGIVKDIYVDLGDSFPSVHARYFSDKVLEVVKKEF